MPTLDLPDSTYSRVWRVAKSLIESDPVLTKAVATFVLWDGSKLAVSEDLSGKLPLLRIFPMIAPQDWYSPDSHAGDLVIRVMFMMQTFDGEDYLNFWDAIFNVFYPRGDQQRGFDIIAAFTEAGAETGLVQFTIPPVNADETQHEDGFFAAQGEMRISVRRPH